MVVVYGKNIKFEDYRKDRFEDYRRDRFFLNIFCEELFLSYVFQKKDLIGDYDWKIFYILVIFI